MKKPIKLTENMLRGMVRKAISEELMRLDEASKHDYRGELRKVIYNYLSENRKDGEDEITDEGVTDVENKFYDDFLHGYSNYKDPIKRIVPIFVRLALEHGFLKDDFFKDDRVIQGLRSMLKYIIEKYDKLGNKFSLGKHEVYIKKLDKYKTVDYKIGDIPNNITYDELKNLCSNAFNSDGESGNGRLKIENIDYSNSKGYEVRKNITFKQANDIGKDSGYDGNGKLCYTTSEGQWENFTNSGENTVYVLLKKGYEDMKYKKYVNHEDRPYDPYGLSMIFLFVAPNGDLVYSNVRWNHEFQNGCPNGRRTDKNFTKEDIEEITGLSFDDHFINVKSNEKEEYLNRVETAVKNGEKNTEECKYTVFDLDENNSRSLIYADDLIKVNVFDHENKRFLYSKWLDYTIHGYYSDKLYCEVSYGNRQNIIKPDGNLMFDGSLRNWPVGVSSFSLNGIWRFKTDNDKHNFIDENGKILYESNNPDEWFDSTAFIGSSAIYHILTKGEQIYIFTKDVEFIDLKDGISYLINNKKYNLKQIFGDFIVKINDNGLYKLPNGNLTILVREDGTIPTMQKFSKIYNFHHGFAMVKADNQKFNYLDINGNIIYEPNNQDEWFDDIYLFDRNFAVVSKNGRRSLLGTNGKILSKSDNTELWFDHVYGDRQLYIVRCNGQYNFIRKDNGRWTSPNVWFDNYTPFHNGLKCLKANGRYTLMDGDGYILWEPDNPEKWFDYCDDFKNGYIVVGINSSYYLVDGEIKFYDTRTMQPVQPPTGNNETNESILLLKNKIRKYVNEAIDENLSRQELNEGNFKNTLMAGAIGAASMFGGNKAYAQDVNKYDGYTPEQV